MEPVNAQAVEELSQTVSAVRLSLKWMGITRSLSNEQKEELGARHSFDVRMVTASRKILDQHHPAMKQMSSLRGRIRKTWMESTLPYVEPGIRLLPRKDLRGFHERMNGLKQALREASRGLEADYEILRVDARRRLGGLYDPADYPDSIEGLFNLEWAIMEVQPPRYLMHLDPDLYRVEQERVKHRFQEAVQMAEQAFLEEMEKLVHHLTDRLTTEENGDRKVFRDSAVDNLKGFIKRFQNLNVTSSPELESLVNQVSSMMSGVTPQLLRTRESWRHSLANRLGEVKTQLDGMLVNRPRRRVLRMEESHAIAS